MDHQKARRAFLKTVTFTTIGLAATNQLESAVFNEPIGKISAFAKSLKPIGRILETRDYYVWCNSPIYDNDGKVQCFL